MSTREWNPGAIVAGLLDGNGIVGIVRGGGKRMFYADSVTTDQVDLKHVQDLRPLVVIDPLANPYRKGTASWIDWIEDQYVEQTQPPKVAEPTGWLAAVEEPGRDRRWYRDGALGGSEHPWRQYRLDGVVAHDRWEDLPRTVRVLSEGVAQ